MRGININMRVDVGECPGTGKREPCSNHTLGSDNHVLRFFLTWHLIFQGNLNQHLHQQLLHTSLLSLSPMASQLTATKESAMSTALTSHRRECTRRSQKGAESWMQPLFQLLPRCVTLGNSLKASLGLTQFPFLNQTGPKMVYGYHLQLTS